MLHEHTTEQTPGQPHRRWFSDENLDLYIWYEDSRPIGFQLCYDKPQNEHALTWALESGFTHTRVDTGEDMPTKNKSPLLVADGEIPLARIEAQFEKQSVKLPANVRAFVLEKFDIAIYVPTRFDEEEWQWE